MTAEYITISAFAERANVSRQAVYSRLDKDLSEYCTVIDNKKMLDIAALPLFDSKKDRQEDEQEIVTYLKEENERLRCQVSDKDRLLSDYAERFASLASREQEISAMALRTVTGQAQLLQANVQEDAPVQDNHIKQKGNWFTRRFK